MAKGSLKLGAAVLVCIEWYRESRSRANSGVVAPEAGQAVAPAE